MRDVFRRFWPQSLYGRTAAALLAAFLGLQALALAVVWLAVIRPMTEQAAQDLASRMVLAAQTWVELPPETRADYEFELAMQHDLELGAVRTRLPELTSTDVFEQRLEAALSARTGQAVRLKQGPDPAWLWAEFELAGTLLRIGFLKKRYESPVPLAAVAILGLGALLILGVALLLARRTSRRLLALARSAAAVGAGRLPERLPETGAAELVALTRCFNEMAGQVRTLLENRTTLLAGISHDLRTPLTRLRLAVSMLEGNERLVERIEADLAAMERLLAAMLGFARSLEAESVENRDLVPLLDEVVAAARSHGEILWQPPKACLAAVAPLALQRIVGNLLENALRYGAGKPVAVELECGAEVVVRVLDRGPGIPQAEREAVFRPFHRLETSRNVETGGSGLGLAIAKQLADAHGWRITLAERAGGGLVATLTMPRPGQGGEIR